MVVYQGTDVDGVDVIEDLVNLNYPQMYLGAGQVALLGAACTTLWFSNDSLVDANVRIVVARAAE